MKRPEFILHYSEIQEKAHQYPGSDEQLAIGSPFGEKMGLKRLGIHHVVLKPGRRSSWPHAESAEEEFVYVIEGKPEAWIDGVLHPLNPGDAVGFPAGTGILHTFINNTADDVRLLVVGETSKQENRIIYSPEHFAARNNLMQLKGVFWEDAPIQLKGGHDGMPDALRAKNSAQ